MTSASESASDPPSNVPVMGSHTGAVAIVTGASRGIGFGIAQRLVTEGARVVITARKPEPLAEAVAALGGSEYAVGLAGNAADEAHQDEAIALARAAIGLLQTTFAAHRFGPVAREICRQGSSALSALQRYT